MPRAAPSARAVAHTRAHYEIHREFKAFGDSGALRAQRSSKGRKCEKSGASALRARSGMFLRLRPLVRRGKRSRFFASFLFAGGRGAGETLAFFRLLPLRGRPCGGGNARIFFACFLFAGGRGAGETLAFFRLLSLRGRPCGGGGGNARIFSLAFSLLASLVRSATACKKFRSALRAEVFEFALQTVKNFRSRCARECDLPGVFARGARARGAQRFAAAAR